MEPKAPTAADEWAIQDSAPERSEEDTAPVAGAARGCRPLADTIAHEEMAEEPKAPSAIDEWAIQDSNL